MKDVLAGILAFVGVAIIVLAFFAVILAFGGLIVYLAWNLGVVAVVAASGGSVGKIGFLAACGAYLALATIKQFLRPSPHVATATEKVRNR